ncbi:hypothetical protein QBC35DRAFT_555851, partial [Podospora australis]
EPLPDDYSTTLEVGITEAIAVTIVWRPVDRSYTELDTTSNNHRPSTTLQATSSVPPSTSSSSLPTSAIVGVSIGAVLIAALPMLGVWIAMRRRKLNKDAGDHSDVAEVSADMTLMRTELDAKDKQKVELPATPKTFAELADPSSEVHELAHECTAHQIEDLRVKAEGVQSDSAPKSSPILSQGTGPITDSQVSQGAEEVKKTSTVVDL